MLLRLQAIQFNHNSSSVSADAFNIRKNEQEFVELPEWRRGKLKPEDSPAAYARSETRGNTLTIKADFGFDGVERQDLFIRALDANFYQEPIRGSDLSPEEVQLLQKLVPNLEGNVLGAVKANLITVSAGETGLKSFELENVRIWDVGVGVHDVVWRWQYLLSGSKDWIDLAVTTHRIYTTLKVPKPPWQDTPHEAGNSQLPWVEVLDHACDWARGAQNTDVAAEMITFRVNDLGRDRVVCYDGSASYTDVTAFDCTSFLALLRGELGKGSTVNCDDCATIVSTFANSVGCDLAQMCIAPIGPAEFRVKPHLRIGENVIQQNTAFYHHMVAAEAGCGENVEVFDACLRIGAANPTQPSVFTLPTNLAFSMRKSGYHFRLVEAADQQITHANPECKRRRLGPITPVQEVCIIRSTLEEHFEFPLWKESDAPGKRFFISKFFFAEFILPSLKHASLQESDPDATPSFIHSLWTSAFYAQGEFFRMDLYEAGSWQDAREALMKILAALASPGLVRQRIEGIGDVTFADPAFENISFVAGNLVFNLRNLCSKFGPLIDVGRRITQKILNPPSVAIETLIPPGAVKRFSFTSGDGLVGTKIRLREEPAHPLAPRRLYQFLANAGEVSRENDQFMYRPESAGIHTLKIFAVDEKGDAIQQTLSLVVR